MSTAGRFAIGSQFELIKRFFFDVFGESDQTRLFSKQELADRYGISDFGWDMQQLNIRNGIDDYAERT